MLGEGEEAFKWHRQSKQPMTHHHTQEELTGTLMDSEEEKSPSIQSTSSSTEWMKAQHSGSTSRVTEEPTASVSESVELDRGEEEKRATVSADSSASAMAGVIPHTSSEQAKVRAMLAEMVARDHQVRACYPACSSVFIEPVEWVGSSVLGNNEGKVG